MFENMMKYEKAWEKFSLWLNINYSYRWDCEEKEFIKRHSYLPIDDIFILSIMPFFFDDKNIIIQIFYNCKDEDWSYTITGYPERYYLKNYEGINQGLYWNTREEALIKAVEKAFLIYNNNWRINNENIRN